MTKILASEHPWDSIEITQVSPTEYHIDLESSERRGEGNFEVDPGTHWSDVCRELRDQHRCQVTFLMPEGGVPRKVVFQWEAS